MRLVILSFLILILTGAGCAQRGQKTEPEAPAAAEVTEQAEAPQSEEPADTHFDEPEEEGSADEAISAEPPRERRTVLIEYKDDGVFFPSEVSITPGSTVIFKNGSTTRVWPASDVHPTHTLCRGFDALRPLAPGESYAHIFTESKVCPFHNHLRATETGTIVVE